MIFGLFELGYNHIVRISYKDTNYDLDTLRLYLYNINIIKNLENEEDDVSRLSFFQDN